MNRSWASEFLIPNPLSGAWGDLHSTANVYRGPAPCPPSEKGSEAKKPGKQIFLPPCGKCYYGNMNRGPWASLWGREQQGWVSENPRRSSSPWLRSSPCSRGVQSPVVKTRTLSHEERATLNLVYTCYPRYGGGMFSKDFIPKRVTGKHVSISKCQFQGFVLKLRYLTSGNVVGNLHTFSCSKLTIILWGR